MADDLTAWSLPAETKEWVGPVTLTADGSTVTAFMMTLSAQGQRPANWVDPTELDGKRGLLVGVGTPFTLLPGRRYYVWLKYTDSPEVPVLRVGSIRVF